MNLRIWPYAAGGCPVSEDALVTGILTLSYCVEYASAQQVAISPPNIPAPVRLGILAAPRAGSVSDPQLKSHLPLIPTTTRRLRCRHLQRMNLSVRMRAVRTTSRCAGPRNLRTYRSTESFATG